MNYYQLLGVDQKADQKAIKNAYKKLAFQYHPDKNPGSQYAENRFKEINNAYQTLSDPEKRALYDLKINYVSFQKSFTYEQPGKRYGNYQAKNYHYQKGYSKYIKERNRIANWWAVGILAVISVIYLVMDGINDYLVQAEEERLLIVEENILADAREKYAAGIFNEALGILEKHLDENGNRKAVNALKKKYLEEIRRQGYNDYYNQDYEAALHAFEILFRYQGNLSLDFYNKVAESSGKVGNYHDAIEAYQYIARKMPGNMEANLQVALIYTYELKEYEKAIRFYRKAKEITIKKYIEEYGKAFVLVFSPERIPDSHYILYCGLGLAAKEINDNQGALEALEWAVILRPDRPEAYYLQGLLYQNTGDDNLACKNWSVAYSLGLEEAGRLAKLNCQGSKGAVTGPLR